MQQKKGFLIDTNVILRFFLNDDPEQSPKAKFLFQILEAGIDTAYLLDLVISECIWVLERYYKVPKREISEQIRRLLEIKHIETQTEKSTLFSALGIWDEINIDWTDALLSATAFAEGREVASFDADFDKVNVKKKSL